MSFRIEHRIGIAAPASGVWEVISDLSRWGEWNPVYPVIEGRVAIGSPVRFEFHLPNRPPREFTGVVVDWVPNHQLIWALKLMGGLVRTTRYLEIEALTEENCILANGEIFDGMGSGLIPKGERALIRGAFERVNQAAKARVEDLRREQTAG